MSTKREEVAAILGSEAMFADGFDEALIGICERFGNPPVALYDQDKCLEILMKKNECTLEEAFEYLSFNVLQAYVGDCTPAFAVIVE